MKTLVLGLGNPILGDDGIGVRVAEAVHTALPRGSHVEVEEACVGGLSLMERMVGYERVIIIDAICSPHATPGTLRRFTLAQLKDISATQHSASAHDTNLITALEAGKRLQLPLPASVTIFAIEVQQIFDFSSELTIEVKRAVPGATNAVLAELGYPPATAPFEQGVEHHDFT